MTSKFLDKRQFRRNSGIVYFHAVKKSEHVPLTMGEHPETMDLVGIKLMNLKARIDYEKPEDIDYLKSLVGIVDEMYSEFTKPIEKRSDLKLKRHSVVISGGGLDLITDDHFHQGEEIVCHLAFPGYPFTILTLDGEVTRSEPYGEETGKYHIGISFNGIPEAKREILIKFVNHLERQSRFKDR